MDLLSASRFRLDEENFEQGIRFIRRGNAFHHSQRPRVTLEVYRGSEIFVFMEYFPSSISRIGATHFPRSHE